MIDIARFVRARLVAFATRTTRAQRGERRLHVPSRCGDAVEVPAELAVDPRVPVGEEDRDVTTGLGEVEDLACRDEVGDREGTGRLEPDVRPRVGRGGEEGAHLLYGDDLFGMPDDPGQALVDVHRRGGGATVFIR